MNDVNCVEPGFCSICGVTDDSIIAFVGNDRQYGKPDRFPMRRCLHCGSYFLSPRPRHEALLSYYPLNYAPYTIGLSKQSPWSSWLLSLGVRKQVKTVTARLPQKGRALDVGCATGAFLFVLRRLGWKVDGVEINPQMAAYARVHIPAEVFSGDFLEADYPEDTFDLITFWDVLEHLPDPRKALIKARHIARTSGLLVVSLPNPDSLEARAFGEYWAGWDIPRHLHLWPRPTFVRLLNDTGWDPEDFVCLRGRHWLLALSLRFWAQGQTTNLQRLGRLVSRFVESLPARALLWPYFTMVERFGLGSIMVIFARRRK